MPFELPPLPYDKNAFENLISSETFEFHHGKHHNAYIVKANELIQENSAFAGKSLVELIHLTAANGPKGMFNQVGQIWNHSFYWLCLSPEQKVPGGRLLELIEEGFGSTDALIDQLIAEAVSHFASGWVALNLEEGKLWVTSYHDADTPVAHGAKPLLIVDVWEHAYYIGYQNARALYAEKILRNAIDWDFVAQNLDGLGVSRADQLG